MIKRILVPLDDSKLSKAVLPTVRDLARSLSAVVYLIHVVDMPSNAVESPLIAADLLNPEPLYDSQENEAKAAEAYLDSLANEWRANGIETCWEVVREGAGDRPGGSIIDFASRNSIDLIAMATHGRTGLGHLILGSVAERVVRDSGLPVFVVKPVQPSKK